MINPAGSRTWLYGLLVCSGALNLALGLRLLNPRASGPRRPLSRGERLEYIRGINSKGLAAEIPLGNRDRPTVLLVAAPGCHWCVANMPNWRALLRAESSHYNFFLVLLSDKPTDIAQYRRENSLDVPAIGAVPKTGTTGRLWSGGTPQTIVISSAGTVEEDWVGAYSDDLKLKVERFFASPLPVAVR